MKRAALRHLPLMTGDVRLTLTGEDGREASATVPRAYLLAKCWGMLADLDPAGLVDAAMGQRASGIKGDQASLTIADQVLVALATGPKTAAALRRMIDRTMAPRDLGGRTTQLRESGLIYRIDQGAGQRGGRAIWKLTTTGELRALQLSGKAQ